MTEGRSGRPSPHLDVDFWVDGMWYPAVIGAEFDLYAGEVLAIVGESGSGKSTTAMAMMGLLPKNASRARLDQARDGGDRRHRPAPAAPDPRRRGAMIFQEPMTALNPVYTVGFQIAEMLRSHQSMAPKAAHQRAIELLELVEIPEPERRVDAYPHQLSGGQRQRAMIAQALACDPKLLVADEPTTALDVTVQAEILKLMRDLRDRIDAGIVLITHDMGVVADLSDRVLVMQRGKIVECGTSTEVFNAPSTPTRRSCCAPCPTWADRHRRGADGDADGDGEATADAVAGRRRRSRWSSTCATSPSSTPSGAGAGVPGRRRRVADGRARRGRRPGRRVRVGQDDDRPGDRRAAAVRRGQATVLGTNMVGISKDDLRHVRRGVSFVFQDPARRSTRGCRSASRSASRCCCRRSPRARR